MPGRVPYVPMQGPHRAPPPAVVVTRQQALSHYRDTVLAIGPALYWRLNETGGTTAVDSSGRANDGTYVGGPALAQPGGVGGETTFAVQLDGSTQYVSSAYAPFTGGSQRTFTGLAWRNTSGTADALFGGDNTATAPRLQLAVGSGTVTFRSDNSVVGSQVTWTAAWPGNAQWVHWALVVDLSALTAELFINGVSQGAQGESTPYGTPGNFKVGAFATTNAPFDGLLDEVAVFERALTAAEIATIYRAGAPSAYRDLVLRTGPSLYWRLDESAGTSAADASLNGRPGTYVGTPTLAQAGGLLNDPDPAVLLDGSTQYITSSYAPFVNVTARTFMGLAYRNTDASTDTLFGGDVDTVMPRLHLVAGSGNVLFLADVSAGGSENWQGAWPGTGQWVHWALVFDEGADSVELFINGVSQGARTHTVPYNAAPGNLKVGAYSATAGAPFDGLMDEIAVFTRSLNADEIQNHAATALGAVLQPLTPGGASVGGTAPVAVAPAAQGGAGVGGNTPSPASVLTPGGVAVQGLAPVAMAPLTQGGVVVGGTSPGALVSLTTGGAAVGGQPPGAVATATLGGVVVQGNPPTGATVLGRGGVVVGGNAPTPLVTATPTPGGVSVQGNPTSAAVSASSGGAGVGGQPPGAAAGITPGGVIVGGTGPPSTFTVLTPGGVLVGGNPPSPQVSDTPTPGGASVGGITLVAVVPLSPGGAQTGGPPPSAVAPVTIGGVVCGGFVPIPAVTDTPAPGGVQVGGRGTTATAPLDIGGVVVRGHPPFDSSQETPEPGGASVGGHGATGAVSPASPGGVDAQGFGPGAATPGQIGGVGVGGQGPSGGTSAPIGGAQVGGFGPGADVTAVVTAGGVVVSATPPLVAVPISPAGVRVGGIEPVLPHIVFGPSPSRPFGEPRHPVRSAERSKVKA